MTTKNKGTCRGPLCNEHQEHTIVESLRISVLAKEGYQICLKYCKKGIPRVCVFPNVLTRPDRPRKPKMRFPEKWPISRLRTIGTTRKGYLICKDNTYKRGIPLDTFGYLFCFVFFRFVRLGGRESCL